MDLAELVDRYDECLRTDAFADLDASANGLQVGPDATSAESPEIEHVAVAVDAAIETIERAGNANADLLLTHHGLVWGGLDRVTGRVHDRLEALLSAGLSLYVSHLPLDSHPELGNAAGVCEALAVGEREPFGTLGSEHIGLAGRLAEPLSPEEFRSRIEREIDPQGGVRSFSLGTDRIESVGVITGSGADWLDEAVREDLDAFVTGEGKGKLYHEARESELDAFLAGHYATETFGVRSLAGLAEEWGLETTVIDHPTGL